MVPVIVDDTAMLGRVERTAEEDRFKILPEVTTWLNVALAENLAEEPS